MAQQRGLCVYCQLKLRALSHPQTRLESDHQVRALFPWHQGSPEALSWMVHALKGCEQPRRWRTLALWLIEAFPVHLGQPVVLVPVPSHKRRNHALGLALALQEWTQWEVRPALGLSDETRSQKKLDRWDRQDIRFERAIWQFYEEFDQVIIVDDVVTTGATARAAVQTLGRPANCEVWCLLDRRPCGTADTLL